MRIQNYKKITGPIEKLVIRINEINYNIEVVKIENYENVFVSINSTIKPRALHAIIKNTREAINEYRIEESDLKIIILSSKDGFNSYGLYDAINNTVYYNEIINDVDVLNGENIKLGHIERHEMYHYKQAENYRIKHNLISKQNHENYIKYITKRAKKYIDSKGINDDNVGEISTYALKTFRVERYDEVEAEIYAKKGAKHV